MTETDHTSSRRTILVADDDPDLLELITRQLSGAGYRVICASDGEQALDLVRLHSPDMAVLDVMMPKVTGLEVLWRLRAEPVTAKMLIVLLSAGQFGPAAAADDYIRKPYRKAQLVTRIQALFDRQQPVAAKKDRAGRPADAPNG